MFDKIYLDMDGVLCDFHKRFVEVHSIEPDSIRGTFTESPEWEQFVNEEHFATLDWFPGGKQLWKYVSTLGVPLEILSSSGGDRFYDMIAEQKKTWLRNNGIDIPVNIVPGKRYKRDFAHESRILIDDTERNIVEFIDAGGLAFLHNNVDRTIKNLELFFQ
jgi:hypothetical protein